MKPIISLILLFAVSSVKAQDSLRLLSEFERFYTEKGVLKKIESARIGLVGQTEITLQKVSNADGERSRMAVVLSRERTLPNVPVTSFSIYIDHSELKNLCKALNRFLEESNKKEQAKNEPYYVYTTSNNVVISLVHTSIEAPLTGWYIVAAQRYADSGSTIPASVVTVKTNEIEGFVLAFNNAKRITDL